MSDDQQHCEVVIFRDSRGRLQWIQLSLANNNHDWVTFVCPFFRSLQWTRHTAPPAAIAKSCETERIWFTDQPMVLAVLMPLMDSALRLPRRTDEHSGVVIPAAAATDGNNNDDDGVETLFLTRRQCVYTPDQINIETKNAAWERWLRARITKDVHGGGGGGGAVADSATRSLSSLSLKSK
jgi:hypothetical protein